jgi:DNA adenine methylase
MSEILNMKTPITYYGGKQLMAKYILPMIPEHILYCEPFAGGAAIFFAKLPSEVEVLNDTNRELINFYRVVQNDFTSLEKEIQITLHSRDLHRKASVIYNNPDMFSELKRISNYLFVMKIGTSIDKGYLGIRTPFGTESPR